MKIVKVKYGKLAFYVDYRKGFYNPYTTYFKALLGVVSPSLMCILDQPTLKIAYETGEIKQ